MTDNDDMKNTRRILKVKTTVGCLIEIRRNEDCGKKRKCNVNDPLSCRMEQSMALQKKQNKEKL